MCTSQCCLWFTSRSTSNIAKQIACGLAMCFVIFLSWAKARWFLTKWILIIAHQGQDVSATCQVLLMQNHLLMAEMQLYFGNPKSKKQQPQIGQHGFQQGIWSGSVERNTSWWDSAIGITHCLLNLPRPKQDLLRTWALFPALRKHIHIITYQKRICC